MAPSFPPARLVMAAIMVTAGRLGEAKEQMADLLAIDCDYDFQRFVERYPYHDPVHSEVIADAVKAAGLS